MRVERRSVFSASHRLWRPEWSPERNRRVFGPSASPYSHGHNYTLVVAVEGEVDPESGMVVDLKWLKQRIRRAVEDRFDHRDLNDDTPYFRDRPPTAENVARVIWELLDPALRPYRLASVRLCPDERLCAEARL